VDRRIGHGGMDTVYLARDARHDRQVAIKVYIPHCTDVVLARIHPITYV
jgi:hypothetical protein